MVHQTGNGFGDNFKNIFIAMAILRQDMFWDNKKNVCTVVASVS